MGHPTTGFLPANFQLPAPFHSQVRFTHGTDRQTDGQTMAIDTYAPPYGGESIIN